MFARVTLSFFLSFECTPWHHWRQTSGIPDDVCNGWLFLIELSGSNRRPLLKLVLVGIVEGKFSNWWGDFFQCSFVRMESWKEMFQFVKWKSWIQFVDLFQCIHSKPGTPKKNYTCFSLISPTNPCRPSLVWQIATLNYVCSYSAHVPAKSFVSAGINVALIITTISGATTPCAFGKGGKITISHTLLGRQTRDPNLEAKLRPHYLRKTTTGNERARGN